MKKEVWIKFYENGVFKEELTFVHAEKKIKAMKKEIDTLDEQIQTGITELEEKYDV